MFRYFWINAFLGVYSFFFCLWGIALSLFDKSGRKVHYYTAVPWAKSILWVSGIKVSIKGLEHVDGSLPRIYMCNHQSYFDIFAVLARIPVDFKFILKQELMRVPFLGPAMRRARYIGIERDDPRKAVQSINEAAKRIASGTSVLIYPEGTRSSDARLLPFKRGGFNLALRSGCDIVPVTIDGSYRVAPKGRRHICKGAFTMVIGRPIPVTGFSKRTIQQLMDRVRDAISSQMTGGEPALSSDQNPSPSEAHEPVATDTSTRTEARTTP